MSDTIAVMREGKIVEQGPAGRVYTRPEGDYTRALLAAVPVADPERVRERKAARRLLPATLART
jgi:ABC-type oligopeptide transport system ATPase subunit